MLGSSQSGTLATGQMCIHHMGLVNGPDRAFLIAVCPMDKTGVKLTFE